ncbi:hypothetical protein Btru_063186, partial [Bulinus truncatus]
TSSQVSNPVASLESNNVRLTFNIPSGIQASRIPIILVAGSGQDPQDVLLITKLNSSFNIDVRYSSRMTVTSSFKDRKVYADLKDVRSADGGMYTCFEGISYNVIDTCGQKLVIVRKPNKPTVQELTSALEGANLKLACLTNSTSLPTDHGLKSVILWRNEQNQIIGAPGTDKLSLDADGHLEIKNIQRTDKGLKLTCTSSDIADGITSSPESDPSQVYEVKPEFKPSVSDIVLKPPISGDDKISKKESVDLTYTCDTTCDPACTVQWSFKSFSSSSFVPLQLSDPKTLKKTVQRADHGTYRCSATNKHGVASKDFELEVVYKLVLNSIVTLILKSKLRFFYSLDHVSDISVPVISLNDKSGDNIRVHDNQPVTLKCVIDALPAPKISWKSNKVLSTETGKDPKVSKDNVLTNVYTSVYSLSSVQCEDNGVYSCEVTNEVSTLEGRINMVVLCPPNRADIDDLKLEQEYVWELSKSLTFSFVIKAFPEPNVINVSSRVHKDPSRDEVLTRDVSITKSSKFDGKDYLTKFTFTSIRNLDLNDKDRVFTITFDTSESKENFDFVIRPRGQYNDPEDHPRQLLALLLQEIRHSSITLVWVAGFNGGETQHFDVEYRHFSLDTNSNWNVAAKEIKDPHLSDMRMEAVIQHLDANTDYQFRIRSTNSLGSVQSVPYWLKTADNPDKSTTDVAGIVAAVVIISVLVLVLVIFIFVKRRNKRGPSRDEVLTRDVSITKSSKFDGKDYLTKFTFTSIRNLDLNDNDRVFTITFDTSESKENFDFVIRPRGPPQTVTGITASEIRHSSITLVWVAGFNGGETQHFDVEYRHFSLDTNSNWNVAAKEIKDPHLSDMRMEAVIQHLDANTDYQFRIRSTNSLGSVQSVPYWLKTADNPDKSTTDVAGIVAAVVIISVLVLVLVIFIFVKRRNKKAAADDVHQTDVSGENLYINLAQAASQVVYSHNSGRENYDTLALNKETDDVGVYTEVDQFAYTSSAIQEGHASEHGDTRAPGDETEQHCYSNVDFHE